MTEEYGLPPGYSKSDYRGMFNYEGLLTTHANNMMKYSDTDKKIYCTSVETFIRWCPDEIRKKGFEKMAELGLERRGYDKGNITGDMMIQYDLLVEYVNSLLEKRNIIFRTGTFEIGHD
ncbi:hypothetical protein CCP3SC1AL1_1720010 [Gammaproteobacteria bacterium]